MLFISKLLRKTAPFFVLTALAASPTQSKIVQSIQIKKHLSDQVVDLELGGMGGLLKTQPGSIYSSESFDADLKRLSKLYRRVDPKLNDHFSGIDIELNVYPKDQIQSVSWCGNQQFSSARLDKLSQIKSGDPFDENLIAKAISCVRAHYLKHGYFEAQVDFEIQRKAPKSPITIAFSVDEGKRSYVKSIGFEGLTREERCQFLEFLTSKPYRPILSAITSSGRYNKEVADQDAMVLAEYLHNLGYADATATAEIAPADDKDFVRLTFKAQKGELYRIATIALSGNSAIESDQLRQQLKLKEGDVLSPSSIKRGFQALINYYGSRGYIDADVDVQIDFRDSDREKYQQDVTFQIDEGLPCRVGLIKVKGNVVTHTPVILHEIPMYPGEMFDKRKIAAAESRLLNTDLFESVRIHIEPSSPSEVGQLQQRDVVIEIEEKPTGKIHFQAGTSNEDKALLGIGLAQPNFYIAGLPKVFQHGHNAVRGGGENAELQWQLGSSNRKLDLTWIKPYFRDTPWTVGVDLERRTHKIPRGHYATKGRGVRLFGRYPLNAFTHFETHYRIKHTSTRATAEASQRLKDEAANSGSISAVGVGLSFDSTNSIFKASEGLISHAGLEIAGVGGNFKFLHWDYTNSFYMPVKRWGTLKLRADLHLVRPYGKTHFGSLPFSERLFLGGENSVRGYRPDSIGPKYEDCDADEPKGGLSSLLLSIEYLQPLTKLGASAVDGFAFVDAGTLGDRAYRLEKDWASTYGFGLRVDISERIPLILGLGYPLKKPKDGNVELQRFFFSLGAKF